jgi:chemotaxis protein MotB
MVKMFSAGMEAVNRKVNEPASDQAGKWLLTFNDMITLLLTFFVLMLSISTIEKTKLTGVANSVKRVAGSESGEPTVRGGTPQTIVPSLHDKDIERVRQQAENGELADPFVARRNVLAGMLKSLEGVKTIPVKNGLSLSLNDKFLFTSGSAEISNNGAEVLKTISDILKRADVSARVEGHTDSTPIYGGKYPSNWELSMARAAMVVRWLADKGAIAPERLSAAGYADTRPLASNDSELNRQLNRRVNIVLTFLKL